MIRFQTFTYGSERLSIPEMNPLKNPSILNDNMVCDVANISLQKWVHVVIVLWNRTTDVYIDGKLTRTCVLGGPAAMQQDNGLWVCPGMGQSNVRGFDGYLASFRAFPYPLNPRQAYEIYREGHGGVSVSLFNKYRLKLAFLKGNHEMGSFEI